MIDNGCSGQTVVEYPSDSEYATIGEWCATALAPACGIYGGYEIDCTFSAAEEEEFLTPVVLASIIAGSVLAITLLAVGTYA